jgi:hypothetical protein
VSSTRSWRTRRPTMSAGPRCRRSRPLSALAIDRAVDGRDHGPILRNAYGVRMDRHAATRRLKHLADAAGIRIARMHPHMLRHTFVTTMLDAGVSLRDVQIAARHADPRTTMRYDRARKNLDRHPTTSSPPTWPRARSRSARGTAELRTYVLALRHGQTHLLPPLSVERPGPGLACDGSAGLYDAEPSGQRDLTAISGKWGQRGV